MHAELLACLLSERDLLSLQSVRPLLALVAAALTACTPQTCWQSAYSACLWFRVRHGMLWRADNPQIWTNCRHHFHLACIYEWCEPCLVGRMHSGFVCMQGWRRAGK